MNADLKKYINSKKTFIIAEAGVNHNGDLKLAKTLISEAAKCGADAVKFQTFKASRTTSKHARKANYQIRSKKDKQTQLEMLKKLELSFADHQKLADYAKKEKILFLSTPKDIEATQLLENVNIPLYKIGSSEINNLEFLKFVASRKKPVIMSTGMAFKDEIKEAIEVIKQKNPPLLVLLHCITAYPCPIDQVNLQAMLSLHKIFDLPVGYSDHTLGFEVSLAAVALGAVVIEKHFTLDNNMRGPDHKVSLDPKRFKKMVIAIRHIEKSLGDGSIKPSTCEIQNRALLQRSIVFVRDLKKGTVLKSKDLGIKRPGSGLKPKLKRLLLNKKLKYSVKEDQIVSLDDLEE